MLPKLPVEIDLLGILVWIKKVSVADVSTSATRWDEKSPALRGATDKAQATKQSKD